MNRPSRDTRRYNGFRWKITWRCDYAHRDGSRKDRRWTVYLYRMSRPRKSELTDLRLRYPHCDFRVRRVGEES